MLYVSGASLPSVLKLFLNDHNYVQCPNMQKCLRYVTIVIFAEISACQLGNVHFLLSILLEKINEKSTTISVSVA